MRRSNARCSQIAAGGPYGNHRPSFVVASGVWLMAGSPVLGHHFFPRESDTPISITGSVARFEMRNPHSLLVILMTAYSSVQNAVDAMCLGAYLGRQARGGLRRNALDRDRLDARRRDPLPPDRHLEPEAHANPSDL